jgi:hypothetical protein
MVRIHGPSDRLPGFLNSAPTLRRPTAPPLVNAPLDGDIRQSKVRHDRDFIVHGPIRNVQCLRKMLRIFSQRASPARRLTPHQRTQSRRQLARWLCARFRLMQRSKCSLLGSIAQAINQVRAAPRPLLRAPMVPRVRKSSTNTFRSQRIGAS